MNDRPELAAGSSPRVAVYIDFDNILISRYDQLFGRGKFHADRVRALPVDGRESRARSRAQEATVDLGAIIDYASSYGSIVLSRAYADWSVPAHAAYRDQLLERAVDLVQLFPTTRALKNGADIRLAVDVVEDLFRLDDISHIVIVAGDSDYIALAQRAKRLGRFVVGIGVAGSTSKSLAAACDEFADYDALPGVEPAPGTAQAGARAAQTDAKLTVEEQGPGDEAANEQPVKQGLGVVEAGAASAAQSSAPARRRGGGASGRAKQDAEQAAANEAKDERGAAATRLLERALRVLHQKTDDEWLHANVVKEQMKRMDPVFNEKSLGYKSFTDFVAANDALATLRVDGQARLIRLLTA